MREAFWAACGSAGGSPTGPALATSPALLVITMSAPVDSSDSPRGSTNPESRMMRGGGCSLADLLDQFEAVHARHSEIRDQDVELTSEKSSKASSPLGGGDSMTQLLEDGIRAQSIHECCHRPSRYCLSRRRVSERPIHRTDARVSKPVQTVNRICIALQKTQDSVLDFRSSARVSPWLQRMPTEFLFDFARRGVALLRDDLVLDRLALLVGDPQGLVGRGIHQFHFDLAELSVLRLVFDGL